MGKFIVTGGNSLNGEVLISGAKNSVLPILAATVLNGGLNILRNVPIISDTLVAVDILRELGCNVEIGENTIVVDSKNMKLTKVPEDLVKKMRSSIIFLGSILARFKEAYISYPGGCNLGKRPIDLHLKSFKDLNISIEEDENNIKAFAKTIEGNEIELSFPSVGATQNIILASIFCQGKTIIKNSAKEPEIEDLAKFLNKIGANVQGAGTDEIIITGVKALKPIVEHTIIPDRIEAGTFLCMAAATKGKVKINGVNPNDLKSLLAILYKCGCEIKISKDSIILIAKEEIKPIEFLETAPYPLFPTDLQPQLVSLLALANGTSKVKESIFEARNAHIKELNKMDSNIEEVENTFIINGVKKFTASSNLQAKDLRGGASLILAALCADGESIIENSIHIERGYENLEKKLTLLGAKIKYIQD